MMAALTMVLPASSSVTLTTQAGNNYVPFHFTDQTSSAVSFFNNMRTPAALLAGAALSNAFALQNLSEEQ